MRDTSQISALLQTNQKSNDLKIYCLDYRNLYKQRKQNIYARATA